MLFWSLVPLLAATLAQDAQFTRESNGYWKRTTSGVVVTAPHEVRAARAQVPVELRQARLIADEEKAKRADYVYVNDGTLDELDDFVAGVMRDLTARP